jgi:hypothetical protein
MSQAYQRQLAAAQGRAMFPPELARVLCSILPEHPAVLSLGVTALAEVLTRIFFASLQTEEREHQPIRVALMGKGELHEGPHLTIQGWTHLPLERPVACTGRNLLRLSRAARADRLFLTVMLAETHGLMVTGLAREVFGAEEGAILKVRAPEPGNLEIWVGARRVLEYLQGYVQAVPEDVLLSAGRVRAGLLVIAAAARAPRGYVECVASIVRHLADHPHGGIVVLSAEEEPSMPPNAGFALKSDCHLWNVLRELASTLERDANLPEGAPRSVMREALRAELDRTVSDIGCMTALDGATILDRQLGVRGFGVVLPVTPDLEVVEVMDAANNVRRPFPLEQYGARHRAAASHAQAHPGSLVFVASTSGDIGCMLREEEVPTVMLWRFRTADLLSATP